MASIINASTSGAGGLISTADNSGTLQLQTAGTTAMTINSSQVVNFANTPTIGGSAFPSGAMTLVSTQTASNSSFISFTGLSGYDKYQLIFTCVNMATATSYMLLQFGTGSGPTYVTSGYYYVDTVNVGVGFTSAGSTYVTNGSSITLGLQKFSSNGNSVTNFSGSSMIENILQTTSGYTTIFTQSSFYDSTNGQSDINISGGQLNNTTSKTAIKIFAASGNITSGTFSLYGISS